MTIQKKGRYYYGSTQDDIVLELKRYSALNEYPVEQTAHAQCDCGGITFELFLDDDEGVAQRKCSTCCKAHIMADGNEYLDNINLEPCVCVCGKVVFQITVGVALYQNSDDVRWFYVGCRCMACHLVGVYGDWKNEFIGYQKLLANT